MLKQQVCHFSDNSYIFSYNAELKRTLQSYAVTICKSNYDTNIALLHYIQVHNSFVLINDNIVSG